MSRAESVAEPIDRPPLTERLLSRFGTVSPAAWRLVDLALACAVLLVMAVPVLLGYPADDDPSPVAVVAFGGLAALPLAVRRRWPLAVLIAVAAAVVTAAVLGARFTPFGSNASPALGLAMYTVAARFDRRSSLRALAVVALATFVSAWAATVAHPEQDENAVHLVAAVAGWLVGDAVGARHVYRTDLAARRQVEAEERTRRTIAEARLQMSRDVHDVISTT